MHYGILVVLPKPSRDVKARVENALQPYGDGNKWDWYQIGGRWSGVLDGYKPEDDPRNKEPNGQEKWPTEWAAHPGDIADIAALTDEIYEKNIYAVCLDGWGWFGGRDWQPWNKNGETFIERDKPPLDWMRREFPEATIVVVDCHN